MTIETKACELCEQGGGEIVVQNAEWRVVLVDDANYPGFCRVIWNAHVSEMTDLRPLQRSSLMQAVCKVEQAIRDVMTPDKINLASLGNMVSHLHWHVIPRYRDDAHFPNPVWANAKPELPDVSARKKLLPSLRAELLRQLEQPDQRA
jgi:diadenosine tetraphosphate (Ap4A) HIT family hydrolase